MIDFKNESDRQYWPDVRSDLKEIIMHMEWYAELIGLPGLIVTSIVRHDSSTHNQIPPYRFIDIRSSNFLPARAEELRQIINRFFPPFKGHDGKMKDTIVALDHSDSSPEFTAPHFHLQVHI